MTENRITFEAYFWISLKSKIEERKMNQAALSRASGVPNSTLGNWIQRNTIPGTAQFFSLCQGLKCNPSELLPKKNNKPLNLPLMDNTVGLSEYVRLRLILLRKTQQLSQLDVCASIGCSSATIGYWETGKTMPTLKLLLRLCSVYKCTPDDFFPQINKTN